MPAPDEPEPDAPKPEAPKPEAPRPDAAPGAPGGTPYGDAALDEIELRLAFVAGRRTMTLGALRALGPGAVIEAEEGAGAVVDIELDGRRIGTGELVEVGGRRAVQVRTILPGD